MLKVPVESAGSTAFAISAKVNVIGPFGAGYTLLLVKFPVMEKCPVR